MKPYWYCLLLCEGSSDEPLEHCLRELVMSMCPGSWVDIDVHSGPTTAGSRTVAAKLDEFYDDGYDLVFVHRDSDTAGWKAREQEIHASRRGRVVPVIPVTMTESWILASLWDDAEFRTWAAHKGFQLGGLEAQRDPKALLNEFLRHGSDHSLTTREFSFHRRRLLQELDIRGHVAELEAWKRLVRDTRTTMLRMYPYLTITSI